MKGKKPDVQGKYSELYQPDYVPRWQGWAMLGCFAVIMAPFVVWGLRSDRELLWFCGLMAGIAALYGVHFTVENRRNKRLMFGITSSALTVLWDGQPVRTVPWDDVIELFVTSGPCEQHIGQHSPMYYGVYVSMQYGYESRLNRAKRQILNLNISPDSMKHLADFPVMRLYESDKPDRCERLLRRLEGYRNEVRVRAYEEKSR